MGCSVLLQELYKDFRSLTRIVGGFPFSYKNCVQCFDLLEGFYKITGLLQRFVGFSGRFQGLYKVFRSLSRIEKVFPCPYKD